MADAARAGRRRQVYSHAELTRLLAPRSIAVVGASERPGSFGRRTLENLAGFAGQVYPVNPRYGEIAGARCHPDLRSLPQAPDCVVVALGREQVADALRECVAVGAGGAIVYASGFAETARPDLVALQADLAAIVAGSSTRLMGPNCSGFANYVIGAKVLFGRMPKPAPLDGGGLAIVAQSGSVSISLAQAAERGVAISHSIGIGNAADVGVADMVSYLAGDRGCTAIACVFESVSDPALLLRAAEMALAADKPLIIHKMAVGAEGAAAALSHTGALAGSHEAYRAALEAAGAVLIDNLEDVVETACFFAKAGRPKGRGVAVVLGSGGLGVAAADKAEEIGVPLPQPEGETLAILKANVPEFGAARNPCDVTAQVMNDLGMIERCADAMLADPAYGALLVVHPYADEIALARVPIWARAAERSDKIVCNYWSTEALQGYGAVEVEREPRIATFRSLGRCFRAIARWQAREIERDLRSRPAPRLSDPSVAERARAMIAAAAGEATLTEVESKAVLALYGAPVARELRARDADEAAAAARELGFPVAVKIESPDIAHKSDAGAIRLGVGDERALRSAFADVMAAARAAAPGARLRGATIQRMAPPGVEIALGGRIDPQFGPLVMVAIGGVYLELIRDRVLMPAPVSPAAAAARLPKLRLFEALRGFRGAPPVDIEALSAVVARFSEFLADCAAELVEVDVNPLICRGAEIVAVDALIAPRRAAGAEGEAVA